MDELIIEPQEKSPGIDFSYGIMLFHGCSIVNDPKVFFDPLFVWVKKYIKRPAEITSVTIKLEYIDSLSTQSLFQILSILEIIRKKGFVLIVNWYYSYGNLEMLELGEIIQGRLKMDFNFVEINEK